MTNRIIDSIVNEMENGKKISEALGTVFYKRNVVIPCYDKIADVEITSMNLSAKITNALLRAKLNTINDIAEYVETQSFAKVPNFGRGSGICLLETILDVAWDVMDDYERAEFLLDTVERNIGNIRKELM